MHAVTCRTEGCMNEGYTLILTNPGHTVVCGPCGQTITDVEPVIPEPELPGGSEVLPDGEPVDDPEPGEPDLETDDPDPAE